MKVRALNTKINTMAISVIIVDDHQLMIDGIKEILEDDNSIEVVGEARNGQELFELLAIFQVDVVLMDFDMPGMNGLEATQLLKEKFPNTKSLILTSHDETKIIKAIFKTGAAGYALKNINKEKLIQAIQQVHQGRKFVSQEVMEKLIPMESKHTRKQSIPIGGIAPEALTPRELEILKLIALEYSTQNISKELFISENTVNTHRKNLLRKTNSKNVAGLVKYAIRHGIIKM